jgi:PHP family Zn ribbon phosphoesterase
MIECVDISKSSNSSNNKWSRIFDQDFTILRWNELSKNWRTDLEVIPNHRKEEIMELKDKIKEVITSVTYSNHND